MATNNYENLGYNDYLQRSGSDLSVSTPGTTGGEESVGSAVSTSNQNLGGDTGTQSLDNMWISNWIKSRNYKPQTSGFFIDGGEGFIECMKLYVGSGGIVGGKLDIPDTSTANSFHVETDGDTLWGTTPALFIADNDNATAYVLKTGVAKFQAVTLSGSVAISGIANNASTDLSLLTLTHDLTFSASDLDTVAWTSGTITFSNGRTFAISAGNTGNMSARTYIYLDTATSSTVLQTTTTPATAHGANKVTLAVAVNSTDKAEFLTYHGTGTRNILVDNIATNSSSTNEFVANTAQIKNLIVTDAKISDLTVDKLTTGSITSKTITLAVSAGTGDSKIQAGKTDFDNTQSGFILGIDDSDSDKAKFYIGDTTNYLNWTGSELTITGSITGSTITGGTIQTTASGQRITMTGADNYIRIYSTDGAGGFQQTGALGGSTDGTSRYLDLVSPNAVDVAVMRILAYKTDGTSPMINVVSKGYQFTQLANENTNSYRNTNNTPMLYFSQTGTGVGIRYVSASGYDNTPMQIWQARATETNFGLMQQYSLDGTNYTSIYLSDGTNPDGNLTGVVGDICYNGPGGLAYYCDTAGKNWTAM